MTILPIDVNCPGSHIRNALMEMLARTAKLAKKRITANSKVALDMEIPIVSMDLVIRFDEFYNGKITYSDLCEAIDKMMPIE